MGAGLGQVEEDVGRAAKVIEFIAGEIVFANGDVAAQDLAVGVARSSGQAHVGLVGVGAASGRRSVLAEEGVVLHVLAVDDAAADSEVAQHAGVSPAELGGEHRIDAVAHRNDGVEVVAGDPPTDLPLSLLTNV